MNKKTILAITFIASLLILLIGCTQSYDSNNLNDKNVFEPKEDENIQEPNQTAECKLNEDCDDGNPATLDACQGSPGECVHAPITDCVHNDGYCPEKCNPSNDLDCKEKNCSELGGKICGYGCTGNTVTASNTNDCCLADCIEEIETEIIKTCGELNGFICDENKTCDGNFFNVSDTNNCCSEECITDNTTNLKTCLEQNGDECNENETCYSVLLNASDSANCCAIPCTLTDACAGVNCENNKKCVGGSCVLKTCSEQTGYICDGNQTCDGNILGASDTSSCCNVSCTQQELEEIDVIGGEIFFGNTCIYGYGYFLKFSLTLSGNITENKTIEYDVYNDSEKIELAGVNNVDFSSAATKEFVMDNKNFENLNGHKIKVVLDPNNLISETNENNNIIEKEFTGPLTDLYGENLIYDTNINGLGNKGLKLDIFRIPALDHCVPVHTDYYVDEQKIGENQIMFFYENLTQIVDGFLYDLSPGSHELKVVIDPKNIVEEANESNNIIIVNVDV